MWCTLSQNQVSGILLIIIWDLQQCVLITYELLQKLYCYVLFLPFHADFPDSVIFLVAAQHFSTLTTLHICLIHEILMVEYNDSPRHYALVMWIKSDESDATEDENNWFLPRDAMHPWY